ncbi:hypothetical protein O181_018702 [Austropuccinia psidii MF-1]|uniref:Succinate dehydrogenase cytochrome b560 subunit, mitochondrial n=1 Tax=Austropuccinia psidii MF-1 TaxID=1389203 RepID=A0A9Q3C8C7_9BASI|nr:hypothetical protein [Austropuccinia psidii MF-1]
MCERCGRFNLRRSMSEQPMSATILTRVIAQPRQAANLGISSAFFQPSVLRCLGSLQKPRFVSSQATKITAEDAAKLLNEQRRLRPSSPHFTIYQPQLTWYTSILNRVTGSALSVGIYAYALGYLISPASGIPMDSETVLQMISTTPEWIKIAAKTMVAFPFTFHTFNGMRHLAWDMGYFLNLKSSYTAGYVVLGLTAVSTVGLALL